MDFGKGGLGPLGDLLGINGNDKASAAIAALKQSPLFTSLFNTGKEAVLQNASATGGLRGGNAETALYDVGEQTLAQVLQQRIANLFGAAGIGESATGSVANLGANKADAIAALLDNIGKTQASGALAKGGITAGMWNSAGSFADQVASAFFGAGGGPGGASFNLGQFLGTGG